MHRLQLKKMYKECAASLMFKTLRLPQYYKVKTEAMLYVIYVNITALPCLFQEVFIFTIYQQKQCKMH